MKEEVKITVIATGFKTSASQRSERSMTNAAAAIEKERTVSSFIPSAPTPVVRSTPPISASAPRPSGMNGGTMREPSAPATMSRDHATLSSVKQNIKADVEQDDLDVPA